MFSLKFIKSISYGSFTWGIMPFLNDVRALTDSYKDITLGFEHYVRSTLPVERVESNYRFFLHMFSTMGPRFLGPLLVKHELWQRPRLN